MHLKPLFIQSDGGESAGLFVVFFSARFSHSRTANDCHTLPLASMALHSDEGLDLNIASVLIKSSIFCSTEAHVDE